MTDEHALETILKDQPPSMVLDTVFDGVYIVDTDRKIVFWSTGAEKLTGYGRQEVINRRCSDGILNHIDENGKLLCEGACPIVETLSTGAVLEVKVCPLHKSGRRFPTMTHIAPIRDDQGNIVGAIEVFRDISKEEELRILQEKFKTLIQKYVSTATFDKVMEHARSGREGTAQIRDLTILHLDVVDFTPFSEKHPPREVARMLNDLFEICAMTALECHGDIDKFIGDAVLVVFPDANDAVSAAKKILAMLTAMNGQRCERGQEPIHVRMGINSGNVIQGDIGTADRRELTVLGDPVNTAARIQEVCDTDSVAISEGTFSRLSAPEEFAFTRKVRVKGKEQEVPIYTLKSP